MVIRPCARDKTLDKRELADELAKKLDIHRKEIVGILLAPC
jgi:hypothetical protein